MENGSSIPFDPDRYVDVKEASRIDGMSVPWHRLKIRQGGGPAYSKCGRAVRYRVGDLLAYMASRRIER